MKRLLAVLLLICCLPIAALAQQALTGTITGRVLDPSGASVPGAQVMARKTDTGLERTVIANDLGIFTISLLPVGEYEVSAKAQGFSEARVNAVRVGLGQMLTLDMKLAIEGVAQSVTVNEQAAAIETTRTGVAASVGGNQIASLGLNGRDFLNFVLLTPGVTRDTRLGDLSFAGQRGTLNNLQVDGTDNNNSFYGQSLGRTGTGRAPYQFSVDTVEEFQVNTSSFSAEFGRAGGAVINVVTKSGNNEFHGSGFEFYRDRSMNANTQFNNSNRRERQPFHANQFGATLGGPIVKDKDFFFFNFDGQRRSLPNPVFLGVPIPAQYASNPLAAKLNSLLTPYVVTLDQDVYLIKNDWQINQGHRLSVRYNRQNFTGGNLEAGGPPQAQTALERQGISSVITDTLSASLASVLTNRLLNEFRFQFVRDDEPGQPNSVGPETILQDGGVTVLQFGSLNFSPRFANIKGWQFVDNVTYTAGRHNLKAGVDINHNKIDNFFAGQARGSYTFSSYASFFAGQPLRFQQAFSGSGTEGFTTHPNFTELGFYIQDEIRASPRLTVNVGLRYDHSFWTSPPTRNPDPQLTASGIDTSYLNADRQDWGPRAGFAYRPLDNNRMVIRGGYGFFYGRSPQILMSTAYNQNGISVSTLTFTGSDIPTYPSNFTSRPGAGTPGKPSIYVFAPDYRLPLILQGSLGLEYELMPKTTIGLTYINVRGTHLSRTRDINYYPAASSQVDLPGLGTRTLLRYSSTRPMSNFARVSFFDSGSDSYYNGMALSFKRSFAKRYQVGLAYTWSKAIDTVPDFTSVVVGADDSKNPQHGLAPNMDRGPSGADQRHRVAVNFLYALDYFRGSNAGLKYLLGDWSFSTIFTGQGGQPFSNAAGGDPNNDGNTASDRVPGDGRNTNHGPATYVWDLRLSKSVKIYERVRLNFGADAFNAFNRANYAGSDIRNGRFNYNAATGVFTARTDFGTYSRQSFDPRILQIFAKISF